MRRHISRHGALLCVLLLSSWIPSAASAEGAGGASALQVVGGPLLPWRLAGLELRAPGGILGEVEVVGLSWDGSRRALYREEVGAWTSSLPFRIYVDEGLRSLEARAETPGGPALARLDLDDAAAASPAAYLDEAARRERLRALVPAHVMSGEARLPPRLDLEALTPESAARESLGRMALAPPPLGSLGILGVFALGAAFAAGRTERPGSPAGRSRLPAIIAASLGAWLLCLALLPRSSRLVLVDLPPPDARGLVSGSLEAGHGTAGRAEILRYGIPGQASGLAFFALSTPGTATIPLEALAGTGDDLVFSSPPLVVGSRGGFLLHAKSPVTGWRVHGTP